MSSYCILLSSNDTIMHVISACKKQNQYWKNDAIFILHMFKSFESKTCISVYNFDENIDLFCTGIGHYFIGFKNFSIKGIINS